MGLSLRLGAPVTDVLVDDVAIGREIGTPEVIQNFVPPEDSSGVGGEKVQQALIQRRQSHLVASDLHRSG